VDHALPISYAFPAYPYSYSVNACEHLPLPVPLGFPTEQKLVEVISKDCSLYSHGGHGTPMGLIDYPIRLGLGSK